MIETDEIGDEWFRKGFSHERRQASVWGNVWGRNEETFRYSLISVPLSFAFPDSTVRQNLKHHFLTSN